MLKNQTINLKVLEKVAIALEEINDEVVYVGGAVVSLYVTDVGSEQPRPTKDIDISVQIGSYSEMEGLRERLAQKQFFPNPADNILYRYAFEDVLIDFIPFEQTPLGPTNSWLKPGFAKAQSVTIGKSKIRILPVSLYLSTKWEAFNSRGGDPRFSHDFEDIVYVIDNNLELLEDIGTANKEVRDFLKEMSETILSHDFRNEIIECHLNPFTMEERREIVLNKLEQIINLK